MAKKEVIVTGDWDEGVDTIKASLQGSPFEAVILEMMEVKKSILINI